MKSLSLTAVVAIVMTSTASVEAQDILSSHLQSIRVNSSQANRELAWLQGTPGAQEMNQTLFAMGQLSNQMLSQPVPPQMTSRQVGQLVALQNRVGMLFQQMQQGLVRPAEFQFHGPNGYEYCPQNQLGNPQQLRRLGVVLLEMQENVECLNEHYGMAANGRPGFDPGPDFQRGPNRNFPGQFPPRPDLGLNPLPSEFGNRNPYLNPPVPGMDLRNPMTPGLSQPNPRFDRNPPSLYQPGFDPNFNQPNITQPGFDPNMNPGFSRTQPGTNPSLPGLDFGNPNPGPQQPDLNYGNPNYGPQQPDLNYGNPNYGTQQPDLNYGNPNFGPQQPGSTLPSPNFNLPLPSQEFSQPGFNRGDRNGNFQNPGFPPNDNQPQRFPSQP